MDSSSLFESITSSEVTDYIKDILQELVDVNYEVRVELIKGGTVFSTHHHSGVYLPTQVDGWAIDIQMPVDAGGRYVTFKYEDIEDYIESTIDYMDTMDYKPDFQYRGKKGVICNRPTSISEMAWIMIQFNKEK
jgi:hypothetical protein